MQENDFQRYLIHLTGRPVELRLNDNVHNLVTCRATACGRGLRASVHRMFLDAPEDVKAALAEFLVRPNRHNRLAIRNFAAAAERDAPPRPVKRRAVKESARGLCYDLEPLARRVNEAFFGGRLEYRIAWGQRPRKRPRPTRTITLGRCYCADRLIRIHPILDNPHVPRFFVEFIVYHEMLHLVVPPRPGKGSRALHHPKEFLALERQYPYYREAVAWQEANIDALLRRWCRAVPPPAPPPGNHTRQETLF